MFLYAPHASQLHGKNEGKNFFQLSAWRKKEKEKKKKTPPRVFVFSTYYYIVRHYLLIYIKTNPGSCGMLL